MIKKLLFFGLLYVGSSSLYAVMAIGDTPDANTTFQFSVGSAIFDGSSNQQLWTLSGQNLSSFSSTVQSYGIAYTKYVPVDGSLQVPLISYPYITTDAVITTVNEDQTTLTVYPMQANPLLTDQAYQGVTFLGTHLTVMNTTPRYLYYIQSVLFYDGAAGLNSPEGFSIINRFDLGAENQAKIIGGLGNNVLFIAQAQGTFGVDSSSLVYAALESTFAEINQQNTSCSYLVYQAEQPITTSTSMLTAGGNDLASIGSSITFYPSTTTTFQMYVGLDVTAALGEGSQAVGLFAANAIAKTETVDPDIVFSSVLPNDVASSGLNTPVSAIAGHQVVVSDITTTTTSTGLSYLITARYDQTGQQAIYAMPLVTNSSQRADNGKIAAFDSIIKSFKIIGTTYRTQGFSEPISNANEIDIQGASEVIARLQVGGAPVPLASGQFIKQLVAQGDSVYITNYTPFGTGSKPGMFKSQALFDPQGRIMSWSPWQRVAGTDDQMIFAMKNRATDATMYISGAASNTIQQTVWNNSTDLTSTISAINAAMPLNNGGVQNIISISDQAVNLTGVPLVIATGNQAVVLAQTGSLQDDNLVIQDPQTVVTLQQDNGLAIGSVVAATFAADSVNSHTWLFMGGSNGLAVLSDDDTGIGFTGELGSLAALLLGQQSCKTVGNFSFVKKVATDNNFIYVLTPSAVYRIALDANKFKLIPSQSLDVEIVVEASAINAFASCTDMLVDNNLILLGTTSGFYTVDVSGGLPAQPVMVTIPQGLSTVSRLTTISNNSNYLDQNFYSRSNLYILSIDFTTQQARLNRFSIMNGVVAPIEDQLLPDQNGPLLIFDFMNNNIFIDGSLGFATCYRIGVLAPIIKYLQYSLQAGKSSTQILLSASTTNLSIAAVNNSLGLAGIARDYASGCLMLGGSFGLLTDS